MKDGFERREALLKEQEKLTNKIKRFDQKLDELKFLYDQYFIGLERTEPLKLRDEVMQLIKNLTNTYIKSTAVKFKVKSLIAKHNTYSKLWDRIIREIEEGKYKRDIFRMKVKDWQSNLRGVKNGEKKTKDVKKDSKDPLTLLFDKYIDSRKKSNERIDNVNRKNFANTINTQINEIKKKFKCKSVSFKVLIENGKTKLKAIPKKD